MDMSVVALVPVEEYLSTSYSPDRDYIRGRLVERNVGEKEHGRMQRALIRYLTKYREHGSEAWPEQRIQITPDHYRVADVCITEGEPEEQIFTAPPLVCIEILSRKDTLSELQDTVDDYLSIGVPNVWIINPWRRTAYIGSSRGFDKVTEGVFRAPFANVDLVIPIDELYSL
jgi:Uma2 family endonuclease